MEKYYISCDMEGITGIANFKEMEQQRQYVNSLMTEEIHVVTEAINNARALAGVSQDEIEILVADSHSLGANITHSGLPANVRVVRGFPRHNYMAPRIDETFDAAFFIGYHARIGTLEGAMDHTFSGSSIYRISLNGHEVGEFEINAGLAGHFNVPVALVSGDSGFIGQIDYMAQGLGFETVVTKSAIGRYASLLEHPKKVHADFREKIAKTLAERNWSGKSLKYQYPLDVKIELTNTVKADMVSLIPVLKRVDGRTVSFSAPDFPYFYNMLCAIVLICWNDK